PPPRRWVLEQVGETYLPHLARSAVVSRPGVVDEEVGCRRVEPRQADIDHQVIGLLLRRLLKIEEIAWPQSADVPRDQARVVVDDRPRVGELRERRLRI